MSYSSSLKVLFCTSLAVILAGLPASSYSDPSYVPDLFWHAYQGAPVGDLANPQNGCSIDQLCPCSTDLFGDPWSNHGKYASRVAHASEDLLLAGLVSEDEKDAIVSTAARSDCGRKAKQK
jgi:hypothetical protein